MKSITIPIQASFKKEIIIHDLEKINLFFGYNGSGKTTISRVLAKEPNTFVYNEDFIEENFRNAEKQKGVFSIGKDAGDAQEKINEASQRKLQHQNELDILQGNDDENIKGLIDKNEKAIAANWELIVQKLWNIKTNTENNNLKDCIPGLRGNKEKLATAFIKYSHDSRHIDIPKDNFESMWRGLLNKGDIVYNKTLEKKAPKRMSDYKFIDNIFINEIWRKKIIGNQDSTLNALYEQLKNGNWVNQGREFLNEQGLCPFCQQTLKAQFLVDLKEYFNESYENDKAILLQLKQQFNYKSLIFSLKQMLDDEFASETQLAINIAEFELALQAIDSLIETKINKPNEPIIIKSPKDLLIKIAKDVGLINKNISKYNKQIEEREKEEKILNKDFWDYYTSYYKDDINIFENQETELNLEKNKIEEQIAELKIKIFDENKIIAENQNKLTDVQSSINSINNSLIKNGFTSFKVKKTDDDYCRIVRLEKGQEINIYKSLSEGEKTILSFLYFIEWCKGTTDKAKEIDKNRTIIIDDPISSLSQNIVFEVSQIIRNEFLTPKKLENYNQIFLLTHNLYLYYEIRGNINSIENRIIEKTKNDANPVKTVFNTYKVKKDSDDSSTIILTDKDEVLTDYDVYWSIVKDCKNNDGYKALLPNAMRNILEYYFSFIKNEDNLNQALDNVVDKKFVRFIQRNSHSDKENFTFNVEEIDVKSFLDCFEEIFIKTKHHNHYKLKMNN